MRQKHLFSIVALLALLAVGQMAWATEARPCTFKGIVKNGYHIYGIMGLLGGWNSQSEQGTSQTFNNQTIDLDPGNSVKITGTLNFNESESNEFTDITTGSQVTIEFYSSHYWFYGATVKTLSDAGVTGCTYSISSDKHTITVHIPSGKTFGNVYLDLVANAPMPSNTTVTVPDGDYWVSNSSHKPTPEPVVTYDGTTLIKGTDYTVSWSNNSSAGTGTVTVEGIGKYAGTATGTFPIRWATYKVHFEKNHSDATGTMPDQDFTYQTAQNLTANAFNRNHYTVAGWSTLPSGAMLYTDQQSVKNLIAEDNATFTLYAKWTPVSYGITYDLAGGSEVTANPESYNIETASFTLNNPTRQGYTFAGWTGTGLSDVTETVTIATGSTGERSYTAHWTPTDYIISYNLMGGEVETANPTSYNIETASFTLNNPTRLGYTFAGWTGTGLGEATQTVTIETGSTGYRSYTANWTPVTYNITYDLAGGSEVTDNPTTYTAESQTFTLKKPTRQWYYFAGWTGTGLSEATQTVTITTGSIGDRHYIANWVFMPGNQVSYIDENGKAKTAIAVSLTGSETEIGIDNEETWYAVDSDITYDHQLILLGYVHLILCDGKTMTVTDSTTKSHYCIEVGNWLHVYGQNGGTGALTVENKGGGGGINSDVITINGGHIKSTAQGTALNALSEFTINDGVVTAESLKGFGIGCGEEFGNGNVSLITINGGVVTATSKERQAIYSRSPIRSNIKINGGVVTATSEESHAIYSNVSEGEINYITINGGVVKATSNTAGKNGIYVVGGRISVIEIYGGQVESNSINSYKNIVLGYTNASDYITSGSYSGTVRIANDQTMTDGTSTYSGQLSSAQKEALAGKTLRPFNVVSVDYIDAEGNTRTATAIALSGTEASLGFEDQQRWYVVNSDISYDHQVELNGNVHLILCDGKTMTMTETDANKQCLRGLWVDGSNLTIYGQSGGTGALTATNNNGRAIYTNRLTINGGHITASAEAYALSANSVLTINGGVVKATTTAEGSYGFCASGAEEACVVINGGQVETSGIECSSGTVTLGYSYADDYIKCDKFSHPYIQIAEGKTMTDGTSTYSGQLSPEQKEALAGKTLRPYFAESPNITLVQGTKDGVSCYWGTFYSIQRYTIPEGAAAYTMGSDYKLYRLGTDGGVIPAGVAVVIISKTAGNTPTMTITLDKSDDTSEVTVNGGGNILRGSDGVIEVTDGKVTVGDQQKTPYVLSVKNGTVDFYPLSSDFNSSIPANKAYYIQ